jgi:thiol:disulfide interchange protein
MKTAKLWIAALQALAVLVCCFAAWTPSAAQDYDPDKLVTPELVADTSAIVPGKPFKLGVVLKMQPGWHTYYKESGEAGMPTRITWTLPPGFKASPELLWKKPHRFLDAGITTFGYNDQTVIAATITPPAACTPGSALEFKANVKWLACQDACVPGKRDLSLKLPIAASATPANSALFEGVGWTGKVQDLKLDDSHSALPPASSGAVLAATNTVIPPAALASQNTKFAGSILDADLSGAGATDEKQSLVMYIALAFIGGFILNFMPCVLPVISIKVLSFMQQAGDDPKRVFRLGLTFTAGIISAFLVLAGAVIAVQQAGQKVGWGFQFQYPIFLFAMAAIVLVFALSLFGLFYVQINAGQDQIDKLASKEGYTGTFFKGVLATTLSTPCSAPFLGTALGFAFSEPPYVVLLMFFTIAVGMAFPYVLLTAQPAWMKYLPKPGVWMEKFKEAMGFLLVATVVWLVWVLGQQVGINAAMAAVGFLVALSFAVWLVGRFTDLTSTGARKATVYLIAAVVMAGSYWTMLRPFPELLAFSAPQAPAPPYAVATHVTAGGGIQWQPFSIEKLDSELHAGKTVFVDFTADWCLTCKANESGAINTPPVIAKFKELGVVPIKADWTKQDPEISQLLQKLGRSSVPLYVIFPNGQPAKRIILPEGMLTPQQVLEALSQVSS